MSRVVVKSVRSGSVGEVAGLKPGDTVAEVYGVSIQSRSQLIDTMTAEAEKHDALTIIVERAGERLELSLPESPDALGCVVRDESGENENAGWKGNSGSGRSYILGIIGVLSLVSGLYFLIYMPGETVNLHRLGIGQTVAIIGALFIAAEWRPKSSTRSSL